MIHLRMDHFLFAKFSRRYGENVANVSEYVSGAYESLLAAHGTRPSHSRKSCPWQNGFQESFYSNFKLELGLVKRFGYIGELIKAVHGQIHYYNTRRIHSAHRMPPMVFRIRIETKNTALTAA